MTSTAVVAELFDDRYVREGRARIKEGARAMTIPVVIEEWVDLPGQDRTGSTITRVGVRIDVTTRVLQHAADPSVTRVDTRWCCVDYDLLMR
jgi:hypothetical protein